MLQISKSQIDALASHSLRSFEQALLAHLSDILEKSKRFMTAEQLNEIIRVGIENAKYYGFTYRGPIKLYVELTLLFGLHFETDTRYAWAAEILNDSGACSQRLRAMLLYKRTIDFLINSGHKPNDG